MDYDPGKDTKKLSKRSESRFFRLPKSRKRPKVQFEDNEEEALTESPEIATTLRKKSKELHQKLEATGYSTLERIKNARKRSRIIAFKVKNAQKFAPLENLCIKIVKI